MEDYNALTSDLTMNNSNNHHDGSHHYHHHHRRKKRMAKQQQLLSLSLGKSTQVKSVAYIDPNSIYDNTMSYNQKQEQISMRNPLSWKKRWTQWLSSCGTEHLSQMKSTSIPISIKKRSRTKSENDLSKRESTNQDEKKTLSKIIVEPNSNENLPKTSSHQHHHHHQPIEKVNNSNSVIYRDTSRHYSNPLLSSLRFGQEHQSRASIAALSSPTKTVGDSHSKQQLSRSADRLNSKSTHRKLRYEKHNDYIPSPLNSIQCHPTVDHYARTLNQSSYHYSRQRHSQIEVYQLTSPRTSTNLPRPYSSNIPFTSQTTFTHIPIKFSSTIDNFQSMSHSSADKNETYGRLSDCHTPLLPVENSSVKAPRRIESSYNQFPLGQQEPVYANTQSLYDNILYPDSSTAAKIINRQEKKSCASQTQLTWTMATFSSFVDLENQSVIIQQPDPTTLYSIVRRSQTELPPSASSTTIEHMKRLSPKLQYIDESISPQPPSPTPKQTLMIEKRDGSFQTLLTISPTQELDSTKPIPESTPSPLSTGSSSTTDHHHRHRHHRHRRHKSRSNTSRSNISTRDVGLQVNIQTVKKIIFTSEKSEDSSLTTSTSSPPTVKTSREYRHIQTNTDALPSKHDRSTSYESTIQYISSSSQTLDSPQHSDRQTKSAQTSMKSLRDQSSETTHQGLFVCDLSSFLKNGVEDLSSKITKQKS